MPKHSWGFDTKLIDPSVRPQDDFYHYAVGSWIQSATIPEEEARWGSFNILRFENDKKLRALLKELEGMKRVSPQSPEQMVRDFYRSGMDIKRRNALGTKPIEPLRKKVAAIQSTDDMLRVVGELHRIGISAFWGSGIDQDSKKSETYLLHIFQSGLGLPDREYYLLDAPEQKRVRDAYVKHIHAMLKLAGYSIEAAARAAETILLIETKLAKASMKKEDTRDSEKVYHKFSLSKLSSHTPRLNWKRYFTIQGASPKQVIVMQPDFVAAVEKLVYATPIEDLKTYLDWHIVNDTAGMLSERFVQQSFAFYGTVLNGTKKMKPLWRRMLGSIDAQIGELLGQIYVKRYFSPEAKKKVNQIVDDLFTAYEARMRSVDWMSPQTKKKAILKLRAVNRKLGYPDKWKSYKGLVIKSDDYAGNIFRVSEYEHRQAMKKLTGPVDRTEWFMNPQTVNAYCSFNLNEIVFPAAILQHPFFDMNADDAVNYGAMGMVIGHEITHAFDDQGSKFDGKGNMRDWWTKEDKKQYEAKCKVVKKQYDTFVVGGLHVNGQLTLGENVADIGGVLIAYDAYQLQLKRTGRKDIDGFTPEQRFFLAYVQSEHEVERPEASKMRILNDPHSPSVCRVNGPLPNIDAFYEAWNVQKGDALYIPPAKRARIW